MKLFEMRGEDAVDVLVDLSEPLSRLIANKATGDVLLKVCKLCSMGMPAVLLCPLVIVTLTPLLRENKEDVLRVAAALTGKPYEDVCEQQIHRTVKEMVAVWDQDLRVFFISSAGTEAAE